MKQVEFSLVALIAVLIVCGVASEIGEVVNAAHRQLCVSPSALPWLWCNK